MRAATRMVGVAASLDRFNAPERVAMSAAPTQSAAPDLAARLRTVHVGLRDDLEIARHVFRGQPSYVIRDPVTFHSHRLDPEDYEILVRLSATESLGDTFD